MKTDLGVVEAGDGNKVEVEIPTRDEDIDQKYDRALAILTRPGPKEKRSRDASTRQEDYYKSFRTRVVLFWLISNLGLIIGILRSGTGLLGIRSEGSATTANIYLAISMHSWRLC